MPYMDAKQAVKIITFRRELNRLLSIKFTITKNSEMYTIVDINPPYLL
jgi:hypothetical protein